MEETFTSEHKQPRKWIIVQKEWHMGQLLTSLTIMFYKHN